MPHHFPALFLFTYRTNREPYWPVMRTKNPRNPTNRKFTVTLRNTRMTAEEARQYVRDAVCSHGGGLHPDDPGFSIDRKGVIVTHSKRTV